MVSVPSYFSCLGERHNTNLLWRTRNVLWTMRLHLPFHQHGDEKIIIDFSFLAELFLQERYFLETNLQIHKKSTLTSADCLISPTPLVWLKQYLVKWCFSLVLRWRAACIIYGTKHVGFCYWQHFKYLLQIFSTVKWEITLYISKNLFSIIISCYNHSSLSLSLSLSLSHTHTHTHLHRHTHTQHATERWPGISWPEDDQGI